MTRKVWAVLMTVLLTGLLVLVGSAIANPSGQGNERGGGPPPDKVQFNVEHVRINSNVNAFVYRPVGFPRIDTAVVVSHPEADFRQHDSCEGMASRGYIAVCAKSRGTRLPDLFALDVKALVDYTRDEVGIENIVLVGHSGGAPMMTYYQNVAENGLAACQGPEKIVPCSDDLADMAPAQGIILLDGHHGEPAASLIKLDPSLVVADQFGRVGPDSYDPTLDPYLEANGYDETGENPMYSEELLVNYFAGQAARMHRDIDLVNERITLIDAGDGMFPDNEIFVSPWTGGRIWEIDRSLVSITKGEHKLLTPDGIVTTVVESIRPQRQLAKEEFIQFSEANVASVRDFLNVHTLRVEPDFLITENDIIGIDWSSQNGLTPGSLAGITVPVLNIAATGHYWVVPNEISHNMTASEDKELLYIEGATHGFGPCNNCVGATPGKYDNVREDRDDYMADWIRARFGR